MFRFFLGCRKAFRQPTYDIHVNLARIFAAFFILYKLFSRDFGFYGTLPNEFFTFYPIDIYRTEFRIWTGLPILTEIGTMHWVHWILPRPSEFGLRLIQGITMTCLLLYVCIGRGPWRLFGWGSFLGCLYLWGHLILAAHEVDSVAIYLGIFLVFLFIDYEEVPIWRLGRLRHRPANVRAGMAYSSIVAVFVVYYFASGYNKLTDIVMTEIFASKLNIAIQIFHIKAKHGFIDTPDILNSVASFEFGLLDWIGPILVYLSHLLVPWILFDHKQIWKFAAFYTVFHFIVFGVGISFLGYVIVWFTILPWRDLLACKREAAR